MKKRARFLTGLLCLLVLLACLLTACEEKYERRDKEKDNETTVTGKPDDTTTITPTSEVTPEATPTTEVTPEATPTTEVTPEATPTTEVTPEATPTVEATPTPEAIPTRPPVMIPEEIVGKTEQEARAMLGDKLMIRIEWLESDLVGYECVVATDPIAGSTLPEGSTVVVYLNDKKPEVTPEPTTKPIDVGNLENTTVVKDNLEVVSMHVPQDADIDTDDGGIIAIGDDYYMDLWYMNTSLDGCIYDADDLAELMKIEEYVLDNLDVDTAKLYGEIKESTIDGVHCYVGPYTEMTYEANNGTAEGCGRFIFFDCVDTCGVYMAQYMIRGTDHETILTEFGELDKQLFACVSSVEQLDSPLEDHLVHYEKELPDGSRLEFIAPKDEITEMRIIEVASILEIYFDEDEAEYIYINHVDVDSAEAFCEAVKQEFSGDQYVYTDMFDEYGRMAYSTFSVSYRIDDTGYTEEMYLAEASDGGMWLVTLIRYAENEDAGEDLMDYIIWSLKEQ